MKIVGLEVENVKHLKVVNIEPDGSLVVVGGDNAAGKTCVLDSIEYALNGANSIPCKPIRHGQKKARVVLDMGDIQVTRTFTENGTRLVVKNKDGAIFPSPQAMLSKLTGDLTFDPLEFARMDAKKHAGVLKKLVGLDFDKIDTKYKELFGQRALVNKQGKSLKARLDGLVKYDDVPDDEVSAGALSEEYTIALDNNRRITSTRQCLSINIDKLAELKKQVAILNRTIKNQQSDLASLAEVDTQAIQQKMNQADSVNAKVRTNKAYAELANELDILRKQSTSLVSKMNKITTDKTKALAKAKFPIEGLAIDDDIVTFEGIPFVQCSTAQQIKISVSIGLAMNPKLRILLIREGSMLDNKNLAMIAKMAEDADAQIWLERVSKGDECSIILEDGAVRGVEQATAT